MRQATPIECLGADVDALEAFRNDPEQHAKYVASAYENLTLLQKQLGPLGLWLLHIIQPKAKETDNGR